jgi:hypothetical protein
MIVTVERERERGVAAARLGLWGIFCEESFDMPALRSLFSTKDAPWDSLVSPNIEPAHKRMQKVFDMDGYLARDLE